MKLKWVVVAIGLFFCLNAVAVAEVSPAKKALIDRLMEQYGQTSEKVGKQFLAYFTQQMAQQLRMSNPNINPRAYEIIQEEVNHVINEKVIKNKGFSRMLYPVYDKYYTTDELRQMIEFNNTPLGKKIIRVMPGLTQESMQIGQQFGQSLAPEFQERIIKRFQKEGIQ